MEASFDIPPSNRSGSDAPGATPFSSAARDYNPRLDGLRCFALAGVVLFHWEVFPAGWIGVEIFFVLSGYLITQILLREKDRSDLRGFLTRFYCRRSLRIFPLYFTYLALLGIAYWVARVPYTLPRAIPWLLTYSVNFRLAFSSDLPKRAATVISGPWQSRNSFI